MRFLHRGNTSLYSKPSISAPLFVRDSSSANNLIKSVVSIFLPIILHNRNSHTFTICVYLRFVRIYISHRGCAVCPYIAFHSPWLHICLTGASHINFIAGRQQRGDFRCNCPDSNFVFPYQYSAASPAHLQKRHCKCESHNYYRQEIFPEP